MAIICRLFELPADLAQRLDGTTGRLTEVVSAATVHGDVYRYWHAVEYLLTRHAPTQSTARWLQSGTAVSAASGQIPPARLLSPEEVIELDRLVRGIAPDDLIAHYDAAALDAAAVYPGTWREWEETFDPLGQVLEHYSFLQFRAQSCAAAGNSLLLVFDELAEGAV